MKEKTIHKAKEANQKSAEKKENKINLMTIGI